MRMRRLEGGGCGLSGSREVVLGQCAHLDWIVYTTMSMNETAEAKTIRERRRMSMAWASGVNQEKVVSWEAQGVAPGRD